jgi:hypothetical protein
MTFFLILAPFAAFAGLSYVASQTLALLAAAVVALALTGVDHVRGRSAKLLNIMAALMFLALGGYFALTGSEWSPVHVRVTLNGVTLSVILLSIAVGFPFTLQYARELVDPETLKLPGFLYVNYVLSWAWAGVLALMFAANLLAIYLPSLPLWAGVVATFVLRNSAVQFSKWYPRHFREVAAAN